MSIENFVLPSQCLPTQYLFRATEAKKILSVNDDSPPVIASRIALAECGQMICFVIQAILYSLAFTGIISPTIAGGVALALVPFEAICSYHTFVHFKSFSKIILTAAAVFTLALCAVLALLGIVKDSAITLCAGGIALHFFRNISECIDARNSKKNAQYRTQVLEQS